MTTYFQSVILLSTPGTISSWSKVEKEEALLALSVGSDSVGIYTKNGLPFEERNNKPICNASRSKCSCLKWCSNYHVLAIGWQNGVLSLWDVKSDGINENDSMHRNEIVSISWSKSGSKLASIDRNIRVCLWRINESSELITLSSFVNIAKEISCSFWWSEEVEYFICSTYDKDCLSRVLKLYEGGECEEIFNSEEKITDLFFYQDANKIISVCDDAKLISFQQDVSGTYTRTSTLKLSTTNVENKLKVCWCQPHTLISSFIEDSTLRLFNFETEDNYIVKPGDYQFSKICCFEYNNKTRLLVVGCKNNYVYSFKYAEDLTKESARSQESYCLEDIWKYLGACDISHIPSAIKLGSDIKTFSIKSNSRVTICTEVELIVKCNVKHILMQVDKNKISIHKTEDLKQNCFIISKMQISGLDIKDNLVLIWSGKEIEIYNIECDVINPCHKFYCITLNVYLGTDVLYCLSTEGRIDITNYRGVTKHTISFSKEYGRIECFAYKNEKIVMLSSLYYIQVCNVNGKEPKALNEPLLIFKISMDKNYCNYQTIKDFDNHDCIFKESLVCKVDKKITILSLKLNKSSELASIKYKETKENSDINSIAVIDLKSYKTTAYHFEKENRNPIDHFWDINEPRALSVFVNKISIKECMVKGKNNVDEVAIIFISPNGALYLHDYQTIQKKCLLVGFSMPMIICVNETERLNFKDNDNILLNAILSKEPMRCFVGINEGDTNSIKILFDFLYHICIGDTEQAVKSIKLIHNSQLWEMMARVCIKSQKLSIAMICIINMNHLKGSRALRQAHENNENQNIQVGISAMHMGMEKEAEDIFKNEKRYDLINHLYQCLSQWDKAIEISEKSDHINLHSTYFKNARKLEFNRNLRAAIGSYEKSGVHNKQIPRMLYEMDKMEVLKEYIDNSNNKDLIIWWAKFSESISDFNSAMKYYSLAENPLSMVKTLCYQKKYKEAEKIVDDTNDKASAFYLARHYESSDMIQDAIRLYAISGMYHHGVRVAKANDMDTVILGLALQSPVEVALDAAEYFEHKGNIDNALELYHKIGEIKRAIKLCATNRLYKEIDKFCVYLQIQESNNEDILCEAVEVLIKFGDYEKAVQILLKINSIQKALDLCVANDITITEDMADSMAPSPLSMNTLNHDISPKALQVAKACKKQGSYHLAAKKFSEAGYREKAVKALIKARDVEKCILFATRSRISEIYIMVANFLRTLDWHSKEDLSKNIVNFYSKAKAYDKLYDFYESKALIDIDDFRDYEKGLEALIEAKDIINKTYKSDVSISKRIDYVKRFIDIQNLFSFDPIKAYNISVDLLEELEEINEESYVSVRIGDVYALVTEFAFQRGDYNAVDIFLQRIKKRNIPLEPFISEEILLFNMSNIEDTTVQSFEDGTKNM